MSNKGINKTEEHKRKIGLANKGKRLNKSQGLFILKGDKKLCQKCDSWKHVSYFGKRADRPIGLRSKCKECEIFLRTLDVQAQKFTQYKSGAKRRGFDFRLTKEEFNLFWQNPCSYCGDAIDTIGIDRIDSSKGYLVNNITSCCSICNTMKLALPREIFINHCKKIINQSTFNG